MYGFRDNKRLPGYFENTNRHIWGGRNCWPLEQQQPLLCAFVRRHSKLGKVRSLAYIVSNCFGDLIDVSESLDVGQASAGFAAKVGFPVKARVQLETVPASKLDILLV
jgi:hypothetical protein